MMKNLSLNTPNQTKIPSTLIIKCFSFLFLQPYEIYDPLKLDILKNNNAWHTRNNNLTLLLFRKKIHQRLRVVKTKEHFG